MRILLSLIILIGSISVLAAEKFSKLASSSVVINYQIVHEEERTEGQIAGILIEPHLIITQGMIDSATPWDRIQSVKIYPLNQFSSGIPAHYLGNDIILGLDYLHVDPKALEPFNLTPAQGTKEPLTLGETVQGISIMPVQPHYFKALRTENPISFFNPTPFLTAGCLNLVGMRGSAVFSPEGNWLGIVNETIASNQNMNLPGDNQPVAVSLAHRTHGHIFLSAQEIHQYRLKDPINEIHQRKGWLGLVGLETPQWEVLKELNLHDQGALIVGNVFKESPAAQVGMQAGDLITAINGTPLPLYPQFASIFRDFSRSINLAYQAKQPVTLTYLRSGTPHTATMELTAMPPLARESKSTYFQKLGIGVRGFSLEDAVRNEQLSLDFKGVTLRYVRSDSPAAEAGLYPGAWVQKINGQDVNTLEDAERILQEIELSSSDQSVLFLTRNRQQTQLVSVKINS